MTPDNFWFLYRGMEYFISTAGYVGADWWIRAVGRDLSYLEVLGDDRDRYPLTEKAGAQLTQLYPGTVEAAAEWAARSQK
jgi:hypothetical protein